MKNEKIGIIGGGALGLTAAYRLTQKGYSVTVFEKGVDVGGLLTSLKIGSNYIEKFYHHIFRTDTVIWNLIKEIGLESKLQWKVPNTSIIYKGKIYRFDSASSVLKFSPLNFMDRLRVGFATAYLKVVGNWQIFDNETAYSWLKKAYGDSAFKVIWEPLITSKFGKYGPQVVMSWFWSRVHNRTASLGYLRGGFFQIYVKLGELIQKSDGQILLKQEVTKIEEVEGKVKVVASGKDYLFDKVLVTVPTNLFFKMAPSLPKDYVDSHPPAPYFAAQNLVLELDRPVSKLYWLNVNEPDIPFLAFVEHTNFVPATDYDGTHIIYLGNYYAQDDPNFLKDENQVIKEFLPHLMKINPDFQSSWVKKVHVFRTPYAQPVFTVGYRTQIPPFKTPLKNVYLANMSQIYPMDRGQNYSMKLAEEVVQVIIDQP